MNNNQFKAFIRDKIESICKDKQLQPIYIDTTSNSRTYYIYNDVLSIKGTMDVWTGNKECSVRVSYNTEKVVSLANYESSFSASYMELDKVLMAIVDTLENMTRN